MLTEPAGADGGRAIFLWVGSARGLPFRRASVLGSTAVCGVPGVLFLPYGAAPSGERPTLPRPIPAPVSFRYRPAHYCCPLSWCGGLWMLSGNRRV